MNAKKLSKMIAEREGKKESLSIAQIDEVVGIISDLVHDEWTKKVSQDILEFFQDNGYRRYVAHAAKKNNA
jgi:hypothetical protein